jgi:hypothetical protein
MEPVEIARRAEFTPALDLAQGAVNHRSALWAGYFGTSPSSTVAEHLISEPEVARRCPNVSRPPDFMIRSAAKNLAVVQGDLHHRTRALRKDVQDLMKSKAIPF